MKSVKSLPNKAVNIDGSGYSENFEDQSIDKSFKNKASMDKLGS
jgi:hypothetical protein